MDRRVAGDPSSLAALEIGRPAPMIGYVDVFYLCTLASLLPLPRGPHARELRRSG